MAGVGQSRARMRTAPCRSRQLPLQSAGQRTLGGLEVGANRLSGETWDQSQGYWVQIASGAGQGRDQIGHGRAWPWTCEACAWTRSGRRRFRRWR